MPMKRKIFAVAGRMRTVILAGVTLVTMAGCATSGDARDPAEGFNRAIFAFNEGVDAAVLRPVAVGYDAVLPTPVRTGVSNVFDNVGDVFIAVNNLLQGKPADAVNDAARFIFNSTFGILGIFDVASEMGLEKHDEDFGQTLGRWGAGPGPYVMLPLLGPRDLRDTAGLVLDMTVDPVGNVDHVATRNSLSALRLVHGRAALLPADKIIASAALDKYSYLRDAYLQRRRSLVFDGRPPREPEEE